MRVLPALALLAACGGAAPPADEPAPAAGPAPAAEPAPADEPAPAGPIEEVKILLPIEAPGNLGKEDVDRPVRAARDALVACYQRELVRDPDLGGRVVIDFVIEDGVVVSAHVSKTTLHDDVVEACLVAEFSAMRFPEGGRAKVSYPLIFDN
jgi:hypothetical protein